ncbi:hypothetical protein [Nitrospirillum sp. BR 11828]|uniref:hypothetical protein n=1 Tax=Nitrospirillum sp. BR 11828 TaxID=3104325 RepID=UPI002ACA3F8F|nr:hypothetical protein [Nitrospirillum sp. BR 11828]MDZ5649543.1 hypothetical protein [Nitrospirillum sp. BR 11828]
MAEMFDTLRERLLAAGIAPRHVGRYVAELREHAADLTADGVAAGLTQPEAATQAATRLGTPDDLAQAMIRRGDFRSWSAKAPWAVYGIAPLVAVAACYGLALAALIGILVSHRPYPGAHPILPPWFGSAAATLGYLHSLVLPLLIGGRVAWMAARQRMPALWPCVALLIIAIIGGAGVSEVRMPQEPGGFIDLVVGWSFICPYVNLDMAVRHAVVILLLTLVPYLTHHRWAHHIWTHHIWRTAVPPAGDTTVAGQSVDLDSIPLIKT